MEKEKNKANNQKLVLIILMILLIILILGSSIAIYRYVKKGNVNNTISTGYISFNYVEASNGIKMDNALPLTDEAGKINQEYFDFSVSSTLAGINSINYEVYVTKSEVDKEIDERYVKIYLVDATTDLPVTGYDQEIPTYANLKESVSDSTGKQLYYGTFTSSGTQNYRLRMWIADNYKQVLEQEHFKIRVNVKAISN